MYSEQNFSLAKMEEEFKKILDENVPEFAKEVMVNIPKIEGLKLPKLKPIVAPTRNVVSNMDSIDAKQVDLPIQKTEAETQTMNTNEVLSDDNKVSTEPKSEDVGANTTTDNMPSM